MADPKNVRSWFWVALGSEAGNAFLAGWNVSQGRWGLAVVNVVGAVACGLAATSIFRTLQRLRGRS